MILRAFNPAIGLALMLTLFPQGGSDRRGPQINERFPIRSGNELSPPIVSDVGECAKAVHVSGFLAHALVRVFVNGTQVAATTPVFDEEDVAVSPALKLNDAVTATQEVLGFTSTATDPPMVVGPYPAALNKPTVDEPIYACGRVVDVENLNPGTVVDAFANANSTAIGQENVTIPWTPVVTSSLNAGDKITAIQTACPSDPPNKKVSAPSAPKTVLPAPNPMVPPTVWNYPAGADTIVLDGLYIGSSDRVLNNGTVVGTGLSNSPANKFFINPTATSSSSIAGEQNLCSSSGPGAPVKPSSTLGAPVIVPPLCEDQPYITVANTYPNSIVVLFRNGAIAGMAGGDLGNITMALGGGAKWALGDEAQVVQYVENTISPRSTPAFANCAKQNVVTQHNDNSRSGANTAETILTPANVNILTFGRLFTRQVEGDVVAQPLYVRSVHTTSAGVKNLFFVATSENQIYAFDADAAPGSPSVPVWRKDLRGELCGARHLCVDLGGGTTDPPGCQPEICSETRTGFVGITSTPVIDASTQTMYVVARCTSQAGMPDDGAVYIFAINLADGSDRIPRKKIEATDPNNQQVTFDHRCQRNRPGLLLLQGVVYVAFATFQCDAPCPNNVPYRGWVIGYRESDLAQQAVYVVSPNAGEAGIWQTGNGLVGAPDGSIYFQTGNGPTSESLQDSFVKLVPTNKPGGLALGGHFQPNNASNAPPASWAQPGRRDLSDGDTDLGSGGPMILPEGLLIGGGKQGRYYVMDRATMNLTQDAAPLSASFDGFQAFINQFHNTPTFDSSGNITNACPAAGGAAGCNWGANGGTCYIDPNRYGDGEQCGPNIHGGPVYWQMSKNTGMIYKMPEKDFLKGFRYDLTTKHVDETPLVASGSFAKPPQDGMPGGFSSISANGMTNGIVWTSVPNGNGQGNLVPSILVAHDAKTLNQLWSDSDNLTFAKSVPPTIADGKVYRTVLTSSLSGSTVSSVTGVVVVYGLLRERRPRPKPFVCLPCYTISEKYANLAGPMGFLGRPTSEEMEVGDKEGGKYRNYSGVIIGLTRTIASIEMAGDAPIPTCSNPKGRATKVDSTIYWSRDTSAAVVTGKIRELYLKLGGPKGKLGYPLQDETFSPDHFGRMSTFQHGEILWDPMKGAHVVYKEPSDHDQAEDNGQVPEKQE